MAQGVYVLSDANEHCRQRQGLRGRVRPAQAGRSASSRLDRSTLLDQLHAIQPTRRRLCIRYWQKASVLEATWAPSKPDKLRSAVQRALSPQEQAHNQVRATARARAQIRRDLLTIEADRMFTLTYRENMTDRVRALEDFKKFTRSMRRHYPNWAAVTVLEWQKRGAAHFHMGVSGFFSVVVMRKVWLEIIGGGTGCGNVDVRFQPDGRGNACSKLACYMGKYLAKDLDQGRQPGEHRYFRCQIPDHPKEIYYIQDTAPRRTEREIMFDLATDLFGHQKSMWCEPCGHGGWTFLAEKCT